jgi:hypothetical protein
MKYKPKDRIQVTYINYDHINRDYRPYTKIIGLKGTIVKVSVTEKAYFVNLDTGHQVYLYDDEIKLI